MERFMEEKIKIPQIWESKFSVDKSIKNLNGKEIFKLSFSENCVNLFAFESSNLYLYYLFVKISKKYSRIQLTCYQT